MAVEQMKTSQPLSATDLAIIVRDFRDMRGWSQDTLSAISKLSLRTIQRVENGEPSSGDTRRALALAFELGDADIFNKPLDIPSPEQIKAGVERVQRETVKLPAHIATAQQLVRTFERADMHSCTSPMELEGVVPEAFAGLIDYLHDFRACADSMTETDKLAASRDLQEFLDTLHKGGLSAVTAVRETSLVGKDWVNKTPMEVTIVYLRVFPKGSEPNFILAPRKIRF